MANSYGFDGDIPETAVYGVYDTENGEWTGTFYFSTEAAEIAAADWDDERRGIVSVTDEDDWLV